MRLALAVVLAAIVVPVAISAVKPHVRLADRSPLVVRGNAFRPHERVTVRVFAGKTIASRIVRATATGAFNAQFTMKVGTCARVAIVAEGSLGSRASWKALPESCGTIPAPPGP